jgi:LacI family gluconate utilization system Gnt-I transcriptional repressor
MTFTSHPHTPLSQRDIADACGVSEMTVSRVMRGQPGVSREIAEKVQSTARRMGYVPNRIAGALAGARVPLVAVIVPGMSNMVFPEVLMGLTAALQGSDLQPVLGFDKYDSATESRVLRELLAWRPAAVVLTGLDHDPACRRLLEDARIPVVEIMDSDGTGIDCVVGVSQRAVGLAMGQAMVAAGHRRAVLLGSSQPGDRRQGSRFAGFEEALAAAGLSVLGSLSYDGPSSVPKGRALAAQALQTWPEVDFLYCTNDMIAAGALFALQAAGRKVPEETGLAGFSGLELLSGIAPRIATTDTCRFRIGQLAGQMILARLAGAPPGLREDITPRLDPGQTLRRMA